MVTAVRSRLIVVLPPALLMLGALAGCGSSVGDSQSEKLEADEAALAKDADGNGRENSPDGERAAAAGQENDQENDVIERLKRIAVELNRERHQHSICDEALRLAEQALRDDPDLAIAYAVRADVQAEHGETAAARRDYKRAFELDRYDVSYGQKLAVCYETEGKTDEALDVWNELCRRFPKEWRNFFGRAAIYADLGQEDKAQADYKRASRLQEHR